MEFGRLDVARLLLDRGANASLAAADGHTALHVAVARWDAEAVRLLLSHGADRTARDGDGRTPAEAGEHWRHETQPSDDAVAAVRRLLANERPDRDDL